MLVTRDGIRQVYILHSNDGSVGDEYRFGQTMMAPGSTDATSHSGCSLIKLNAGENVRVVVFQNSGSTRKLPYSTVDRTRSEFWAVHVSDQPPACCVM